MKILVSGAGIAGSAATLFLRAHGHDVVTIDKAPAFHPLGYVLSLKYFGLAIVKELGVSRSSGDSPFPTPQWRSTTRRAPWFRNTPPHGRKGRPGVHSSSCDQTCTAFSTPPPNASRR